jgi:hypothetical protein
MADTLGRQDWVVKRLIDDGRGASVATLNDGCGPLRFSRPVSILR